MIANPQKELMSRAQLTALQQEKLQKEVRWAAAKTAYYAEALQRAGVSHTDIRTAEDIGKLPLLTRETLYETPMLDFSTMPLSSMLRLQYLTSEQGKLARLYTNGDIAHNIEMVTRCLVAAGLHNASVAGWLGDGADSRLLDIHYALEFVGAAVMPMGETRENWQPMLELARPDVLIGSPEELAALEAELAEGGEKLADYPVRKVILLYTNRRELRKAAPARADGIAVYPLLALPEWGTPGIFLSCEPGKLIFHLAEDLYLAEILDTEGKPAGEGELVLTALEAQAMPLLRLETGLLVRKMPETCSCGRTGRRVEILGVR